MYSLLCTLDAVRVSAAGLMTMTDGESAHISLLHDSSPFFSRRE